MPFVKAVLTLAGMVIGAGMFAIPFSFAQAGFWAGAGQLIVLSAVVLAMHLLYARIVLETPSYHRMPGYIRVHLGRLPAAIAWASALFGTTGTLLAYLAIDTVFLRTLIAGGGAQPPLWWVAGLAGAVAVITFFPLKKEAVINGVLTVFEIAFITALPILLAPHVSLSRLAGAGPGNFLAPFGVLLFALSGGSVIPDMITVLGRDKKKVRLAVIAGSLIPAALYFFFAFAVVGVSGAGTSREAVAGLRQVIGDDIALWAAAAGFFAVLTSYIALSANFQATLRLDMGMPRTVAWFAASFSPFILYLLGLQNFIAIISVVGVAGFGTDALLVAAAHRAMRRNNARRVFFARVAEYSVVAVAVAGVILYMGRFFVR
jgi:tyrosine-specific transport protein